MKHTLFSFNLMIAPLASLAASQSLAGFVQDYYGTAASSCVSQANNWLELEDSSCTENRSCLCSIKDAVFFEKFICCIAQAEDFSANMNTINNNFEAWCSARKHSETPNQAILKDSPPLPSTCSTTGYTMSTDDAIFRRGIFGSDPGDSVHLSSGAVAGIIIVSLGVFVAFSSCILSSWRNQSQAKHLPPALPLHTARRLTDPTRRYQTSIPRRLPAAVVRGEEPPPPPYSAKDEPAPRYT